MNSLVQIAVFAAQNLKPDALHFFVAHFNWGVHWGIVTVSRLREPSE